MADVKLSMSWKHRPVPGSCPGLHTPGSPRLDLIANAFLITCMVQARGEHSSKTYLHSSKCYLTAVDSNSDSDSISQGQFLSLHHG